MPSPICHEGQNVLSPLSTRARAENSPCRPRQEPRGIVVLVGENGHRSVPEEGGLFWARHATGA